MNEEDSDDNAYPNWSDWRETPLQVKDIELVYDSIDPALADSYFEEVTQVKSHLPEEVAIVRFESDTQLNEYWLDRSLDHISVHIKGAKFKYVWCSSAHGGNHISKF